MNAQPIENEAQEQHPIANSNNCGATVSTPTGIHECELELFHPGNHSEGKLSWVRR